MNDIMIKHIAVSSHNRKAKLTILLNKNVFFYCKYTCERLGHTLLTVFNFDTSMDD